MKITVPILRYAEPLIGWLRTGVVRVGAVQVNVPLPAVKRSGDALVIECGSLVAKLARDETTDTIFRVLADGRLRVAPGTDLVIPEPLAFVAEAEGDGVRLYWPPGTQRPWIDTPNPLNRIDPVIVSITLRPGGGQIVLRRGPDIEVTFA